MPVFSSINSTLLSLDSELSYLENNLESVNSNLSTAVAEVSKQQGPPGLNGTQVCIWLPDVRGWGVLNGRNRVLDMITKYTERLSQAMAAFFNSHIHYIHSFSVFV